MATNDRPVKCPVCGEMFKRSQEEYIHFKRRYYHKACYEKTLSAQDKAGLEKDELLSYICQLFRIDYVNPRIHKQINTFIQNYNYTYKGIQLTLEYFYEIKGNSIEKANGGIGIVPYVYEDAKQLFIRKMKAEQYSKEVQNIEIVVKKKVTIKPPRPKGEKKDKEIDISSL